jgi:colanic acid biosynthesis glycosyl transferase WcaI
MKPHVLFVNRVYPPSEGATGEMLATLAEHLAEHGFRVTVATGPCPDRPNDEVVRGVRILRVAGAATRLRKDLSRTGVVQRVLGYAALYPKLLRRARQSGPVDVVVTKTDPPLLLLLGPLLARGGVRLVHWAQDLYPEVAEALGVLAPAGMPARLLRTLSTWALRRSDAVVAIGACMAARLVARGVDPHRIHEIPNWALGEVHPIPHAANAWRREQGLDGCFVVMYSGNMGLAHPFEAMLEAAALLQHEAPEVRFLFVGSGARKAWIEAEAVRRRLANVRVLPFQPKERLAESLSAADLHLVSMEHALDGLVVPSKIYGVAAAGRPCLFLGPGESEAARFIARTDLGTVVPEATGPTLAATIAAWHADPARRVAAGVRAAAGAVTSRRASLTAFEQLLRETASPGTPGRCSRLTGPGIGEAGAEAEVAESR